MSSLLDDLHSESTSHYKGDLSTTGSSSVISEDQM
jgi:hypothetical protein